MAGQIKRANKAKKRQWFKQVARDSFSPETLKQMEKVLTGRAISIAIQNSRSIINRKARMDEILRKLSEKYPEIKKNKKVQKYVTRKIFYELFNYSEEPQFRSHNIKKNE